MNISLILSTFKRPVILKKTLESFCNLVTKDLSWEVLLVDNADDVNTKECVDAFKGRLPIQYFIERKQGKNSALNFALKYAKGELIVFTDDDIIVENNWLLEIYQGVKRWPNYSVFGGRILPHWPEGKRPPENINASFLSEAYVIASWDFPEGPYLASKVWGPNMAIRRKIFEQGWKFSTEVGPSGINYIMGSETELTKRLEAAGYASVYLPKASVFHQIREEQLKQEWLCQRAFRYGRAQAYNEGSQNSKTCLKAPRYLYRILVGLFIKRVKMLFFSDKTKKFNVDLEYWRIRGQIYQHQRG